MIAPKATMLLPPPLRRQLLAGLGLTVTGSGAVAAAFWWRGGGGDAGAGSAGDSSLTGPFVGRDAELRALHDLSATAGWAPVWLLRGDRGAGKTRLLRAHAMRERLQGRTVVELSLRDGLDSSQLAATLARGLGLAGAASFEAINAQLDEQWRGADRLAGEDGPAATMVPLVIADDVPTDSAGVFTTDVGAALAAWACGAAGAGYTRVVLVARDSLPSYRNTRSSSDVHALHQTRMLWLDWLPVEDGRELARTLASGFETERGTQQTGDAVPTPESAQQPPGSVPLVAENEPRIPEEVHMASASGCPGEMIELLSGGLALEDTPETVAGSGMQPSGERAPPSATERAIARRETTLLKLMGLPLLPPHGADSPTDLIALLSTAETEGVTSAAACWVVASWEAFARLGGLTPDGSTADTIGMSPHELLQQWNETGEGGHGFRRGGRTLWCEICASLLSGRLGMEAVVRQRLGLPVPSTFSVNFALPRKQSLDRTIHFTDRQRDSPLSLSLSRALSLSVSALQVY